MSGLAHVMLWVPPQHHTGRSIQAYPRVAHNPEGKSAKIKTEDLDFGSSAAGR